MNGNVFPSSEKRLQENNCRNRTSGGEIRAKKLSTSCHLYRWLKESDKYTVGERLLAKKIVTILFWVYSESTPSVLSNIHIKLWNEITPQVWFHVFDLSPESVDNPCRSFVTSISFSAWRFLNFQSVFHLCTSYPLVPSFDHYSFSQLLLKGYTSSCFKHWKRCHTLG